MANNSAVLTEVPGWSGKFFIGLNHTYWWKEKPGSVPRPLSGITTVLNVIAKPALIQWAANMAVEYVLASIRGLPDNDITADLISWKAEEARTAHNKKKDKAAGLGTDAHALVEEYIVWCIKNHSGIPSPLFQSIEPRVTEFATWALARNAKTDFKFLASETPLADPKLALAGTPDFIGEEMIDGNVIIIIGDLKTGSGVYDRTFFAQMAAYGYMWAKKNVSKLRMALVVIHMPSQKPAQAMAEYWSEDMKGDWQGFKSALYLHRWKDNFNKPVWKKKV